MRNHLQQAIAATVCLMVGALWPAQAADKVWDAGGGATTLWSTPANWDLNTLPAVGDNITFATGGSTATVDGNQTVGSITLNRAADFSVVTNGSYTITMSGGLVSTPPGTQSYTLSVPLAGSGGVSHSGAGTIRLNSAANSFTGNVILNGGTLDISNGGSINPDLFFGDGANDLVFSNGASVVFGQNSSWNPGAGRTITIGPGGAEFRATVHTVTFDDADQVQGTGPLTFRHTTYGSALNVSAAQPNYSGGFLVQGASRRNSILNASATDSLGTGVAMARGNAIGNGGAYIDYVWGAQKAVGGVLAGVIATTGGTIRVTSAGAGTTYERFTIADGSGLGGNSTALPSVRRVSSFSIAPTGPEAMIAPGAIVLHTTGGSSNTIANLGTSADLYFGLDVNFTSAGFTLDIGSATPWKGISNTTINDQGTGVREIRLQAGTVNIATGTAQIDLRGNGVDYSSNPAALIIGNGATSPTFTALGSPVLARILNHVKIDTTAPGFGGLSKFIVEEGGRLTTLRTGGLATKPVDLVAGTLALAPSTAGNSDSAGAVTASRESTLLVTRRTAGTPETLTLASLTRSGNAFLGVYNSTATQLAGDEKITMTNTNGLYRGKIVDPWIVATGNGSVGDFLQYDSVNGMTSMAGSYDASFGDGNIVEGATSVAGTVSADSLRVNNSISGAGQINLGVLPDGSQAARAGLILAVQNLSIAPALNAGTSELVMYGSTGGPTRFLNLNGAVTANGLTKAGVHILGLYNAANNISGTATVWNGTLRVGGGNGLNDAATVHVGSLGKFDLVNATGNSETIAGLSGNGAVALASGKTLELKNLATPFAFDGVISGAGNLLKSGTGTQILAGINTYTGTTTVNGGSLLVQGSVAGSAITVGAGGSLGGTGTIGNLVVVQNGGTLSPGASPGVLSFDGGLSLESNAFFVVELNGLAPGTEYDVANVTGPVSVSNAVLNVSLGFTPTGGDSFVIISNDASDTVFGTFAGLAEGAVIPLGNGLQISYLGGDGNDVVLTALMLIPEPGTLLLLALGGLVVWRRRTEGRRPKAEGR